MTPKDQKTEPQTVEEVAKSAKDSAIRRDQEAVEQWKAAVEETPSSDETTALWEKFEMYQADAEQMREEYARATVRRALAYGWVRIATEQGISAKQLHAWHKQYLPDLPDLSRIPEREMRREERRIADLEKRLATEKRLREKYNEAQKRLADIKNGVNK